MIYDFSGLPIGFGIMLSQNSVAMNRFASMSEREKHAAMEGIAGVRTKQEMKSYIDSIVSGETNGVLSL